MADMLHQIQIKAAPEKVYEALNDNFTSLRFTHANWRSTEGWFATCNSTWGEAHAPSEGLCRRQGAWAAF